MQQSSSLRLDKNEYLFAFINDRLSFSFTFLLNVGARASVMFF